MSKEKESVKGRCVNRLLTKQVVLFFVVRSLIYPFYPFSFHPSDLKLSQMRES